MKIDPKACFSLCIRDPNIADQYCRNIDRFEKIGTPHAPCSVKQGRGKVILRVFCVPSVLVVKVFVMKRLQKFLGLQLDLTRIQDDDALLESFSIEKRYVPDELDIFDELEFGLGPFGTKTVVLLMVLENGKLQRASLGWIPEGGDEDDFAAFTELELADVMELMAPRIESLFEEVLK